MQKKPLKPDNASKWHYQSYSRRSFGYYTKYWRFRNQIVCKKKKKRIRRSKKKHVIFQPPNDQDNIKFSKPYCASIGYFKKFSNAWFVYCVKCRSSAIRRHFFLPIIWPRGLQEKSCNLFKQKHYTQIQTPQIQFAGFQDVRAALKNKTWQTDERKRISKNFLSNVWVKNKSLMTTFYITY